MYKISESEYLKAIQLIIDYQKQIEELNNKTLGNKYANLTMSEILANNKGYIPYDIPVRLGNILKYSEPDVKLKDIDCKRYLSFRGAGKKSWNELCDLIGKEHYY